MGFGYTVLFLSLSSLADLKLEYSNFYDVLYFAPNPHLFYEKGGEKIASESIIADQTITFKKSLSQLFNRGALLYKSNLYEKHRILLQTQRVLLYMTSIPIPYFYGALFSGPFFFCMKKAA